MSNSDYEQERGVLADLKRIGSLAELRDSVGDLDEEERALVEAVRAELPDPQHWPPADPALVQRVSDRISERRRAAGRSGGPSISTEIILLLRETNHMRQIALKEARPSSPSLGEQAELLAIEAMKCLRTSIGPRLSRRED